MDHEQDDGPIVPVCWDENDLIPEDAEKRPSIDPMGSMGMTCISISAQLLKALTTEEFDSFSFRLTGFDPNRQETLKRKR